MMTRRSYTCKFPAQAGWGVGHIQTMQSLRLWLRDVLQSPLVPVAQQPVQPWLGQWAAATGAEGVGGCRCQLLSRRWPQSHQAESATFDLGWNRAVPGAVYCAASSSLENAPHIAAQQTEEMECSRRGET